MLFLEIVFFTLFVRFFGENSKENFYFRKKVIEERVFFLNKKKRFRPFKR